MTEEFMMLTILLILCIAAALIYNLFSLRNENCSKNRRLFRLRKNQIKKIYREKL